MLIDAPEIKAIKTELSKKNGGTTFDTKKLPRKEKK